MSPSRQPAHHDAAHRGVHEGFPGLAEPLIVLAEPPAIADPRECPLHNPPPGQHTSESGLRRRQAAPLERARIDPSPKRDPLAPWLRRVLDDLDAPSQLAFDPLAPAAGVALVHPHMIEPWEPVRR